MEMNAWERILSSDLPYLFGKSKKFYKKFPRSGVKGKQRSANCYAFCFNQFLTLDNIQK